MCSFLKQFVSLWCTFFTHIGHSPPSLSPYLSLRIFHNAAQCKPRCIGNAKCARRNRQCSEWKEWMKVHCTRCWQTWRLNLIPILISSHISWVCQEKEKEIFIVNSLLWKAYYLKEKAWVERIKMLLVCGDILNVYVYISDWSINRL